jgi:NADPH2:quinone reductase
MTGENSRFAKGDKVLILRSPVGVSRQGTLAEFVAVPEESVAPLPENWTFEDGAACSVVYLTAWKALVVQGGLQSGETVLINGASGGVGTACIQIAKARGARIVALSRDAEKRGRLLELGADLAVDSGAEDLEDQVEAGLAGAGADVIVENLGGKFLQTSVNMANPNGRIMVVGLLAGRESEINMGLVLFKQVRIEGVHVGKFTPAQAQEAWTYVVETLNKSNQRPLIDEIFAMEDVQKAFARLNADHLGKVLVRVGGSA